MTLGSELREPPVRTRGGNAHAGTELATDRGCKGPEDAAPESLRDPKLTLSSPGNEKDAWMLELLF